jgi:hypothetical protein
MLSDLKKKDSFYETYVKSSEELTKLRQAHTILISLIQKNHINIRQEENKISFAGVDNHELNLDKPLAN